MKRNIPIFIGNYRQATEAVDEVPDEKHDQADTRWDDMR